MTQSGLLGVLSSFLGAVSGLLAMGLLLWGPHSTWDVIVRAARLFFLGDKRWQGGWRKPYLKSKDNQAQWLPIPLPSLVHLQDAINGADSDVDFGDDHSTFHSDLGVVR
jgi:hypothetical protein